jgi:hypothetical protein
MTSFHQVFLDTFPLDLLEVGACAIVGRVWNYYVITRFFVHFPMGFPWNGLVCGVVGDILKQTKIFFLETSGLQGWIARTIPFQPSLFCIGEVSKCGPFWNLRHWPTGGTQNS